MDVENNQTAGTETPAGAGNTGTDNRVPQSRLNEVIAERNEARNQIAELAQQIEAIKAAQLKEKEDYKALYEQAESKLSELQPKAAQVETMREALNKTVEAQIELLPDEARELVPEFGDPQKTLDWLNKNAAKLRRPAAPAMDAGTRGDSLANAKLTPEQEEAYKRSGMTRERYIELLNLSNPH